MELLTQHHDEHMPVGLRHAELTAEHMAAIALWRQMFQEPTPQARAVWSGQGFVARVWCSWRPRARIEDDIRGTGYSNVRLVLLDLVRP